MAIKMRKSRRVPTKEMQQKLGILRREFLHSAQAFELALVSGNDLDQVACYMQECCERYRTKAIEVRRWVDNG